MIGRALIGDIQRHLDPVLLGLGHKAAKILERAKLRVYRVVSALLGADPPRAADVVGRAQHGIVFALAVGAADRVDRREVDDIETQRSDIS